MKTTLHKIGYQTYELGDTGAVIRRSTNPNALPCFRWNVDPSSVSRTVYAAVSGRGFQLRTLAQRVADAIGAEAAAA